MKIDVTKPPAPITQLLRGRVYRSPHAEKGALYLAAFNGGERDYPTALYNLSDGGRWSGKGFGEVGAAGWEDVTDQFKVVAV